MQFYVIASGAKQTGMLNFNGLLRAIALAMTEKATFETVSSAASFLATLAMTDSYTFNHLLQFIY